MIEKEAPIKIYNETLGAKGAKGRLVRIADEGFYEVIIESGGRDYTSPPADRLDGDPGSRAGGAGRDRWKWNARMPRGHTKVVHLGLGPIGQGIARLVLGTEGLQVVGAADPSPDLVGKDLGAVLGGKKIRVKIAGDPDKFMQEGPGRRGRALHLVVAQGHQAPAGGADRSAA